MTPASGKNGAAAKKGGAVIELEDVTHAHGDRAVFEDVSLRLEPGSFHFLTGPSGAGKTTLLDICHGARVPRAGRVRLFGQAREAMSRDDIARLRRRVGLVRSDNPFLDHLDIAENIALPLDVSGRDRLAEEINLRDLLAWVGLRDRAKACPAELSADERQRAALARAVILSPDLVLADEPTGAVDPETSERLMRLLVDLNRTGIAVCVATHDLALIRAFRLHVPCTILRFSDGRLETAGAEL